MTVRILFLLQLTPLKMSQILFRQVMCFRLLRAMAGTLVRAGHTEAAVDLARIAGLYPAGVICEIMNDDGTMARLPDLVKFAQFHGLKLGTIADLIAYRRKNDTLVERIHEADIDLVYGGTFKSIVYKNKVENEEHIAFVKGDISGDEPVLVRMHAENILLDLFKSNVPKAQTLSKSFQLIGEEERGVLVLIRNTSPTPFTDYMQPKDQGANPMQLREYGVGAQIISDLGLSKIELLSDTPRTIVALEGYDIEVSGQRPIFGDE